MYEKVLFLPLAISDEGEIPDEHLSRQIPILVRNVVESHRPGFLIAAPLATQDSESRTWVVQHEMWDDDAARDFAASRGYDAVVFGKLAVIDEGYRLVVRALRCADGETIAEAQLDGGLVGLCSDVLGALAPLFDGEDHALADLFAHQTSSDVALNEYLRGLDVLLAIRSQGMEPEHPGRALEPFDEALTADPAFVDALTAGLSCALQVVDPQGSTLPIDVFIETLRQWVDRFPGDARITAVLVELLIHARRPQEALDACERGLATLDAANRDLLRRRGDLLVEVGRTREALEAYLECQEMAAEPALAERIARLQIMLGENEDARETLLEIADTEDRPELWARLALIAHRSGNDRETWSALSRMFKSPAAPSTADLVKVGTILSKGEAPDSFKQTLRFWYPPDDFPPAARLALARALRLCGALLEARLCLRAMEGMVMDEGTTTKLARERLNLHIADFDKDFASLAASIVNNEVPDGVDLLDQAIEVEPDFWPGRFLRGLVFAGQGKVEDALAEFRTVLDQQPRNDVVWYTQGLHLLKLGRAEEAVASFESALEIKGEEREYLSHLALSFAQLGRRKDAEATCARVKALDPEHPRNAELEERVGKLLE